MRTVAELARAIAPDVVRQAGAIRRMVVTLTAKTIWQLAGFDLGDGKKEVEKSEVFGGIGFYARPPKNSKAEAIVTMVGGPGIDTAPAVVATRDEKTRAAVDKAIGGFKEDESAVFNTKAILRTKADGTIEARSIGGVAETLAPSAELGRLLAALAAVATAIGGANPTGAAALQALHDYLTTTLVPAWPRATTKFKGE